MRRLKALLLLCMTIALVAALNKPWGSIPALGPLLDPVNGAMANAEAEGPHFPDLTKIPGLQQPVTVWIDRRWVPHLHAGNDHDLYLVQGYLHASMRLWQMDLQTRAAGGRVSEIVGEKAIDFDIKQRRKGMVYAAEQSLCAMEAEPRTRAMMDAYTEGINAWIRKLEYRTLPLEYKLMGFRPEPWTNLRSALLLKYMADDLTGSTDDIGLTWLRDRLSGEDFARLYPEKISGSLPVIPAGTPFEAPSMSVPQQPAAPDSLFAHFSGVKSNATAFLTRSEEQDADERGGIGSNNWAVSGRYTSSGAPVLCNDPHLGLNLPSLWYEIQLQSPGMNAYGVSLPGAPGIVIGFNDSLSWGFTNNYRDVKDYYEIIPVDAGHYWFNGEKRAYEQRIERIVVKGNKELLDTVLYTVHGPVQYDARHPDAAESGKMLAMTWMAHRPTNELLALNLLNRARNYTEFTKAIQHFECPAQNMVYADRAGNIALWGQGRFINKWREQGRYVMEGKDSLTLWGKDIPTEENPHVLNPPQGYLASANQSVTDPSYPYYYNGTFYEFRSWRIHELLASLSDTVHAAADGNMMRMQNDVVSYLAARVWENLIAVGAYPGDAWEYGLDPENRTATSFQIAWFYLYRNIWEDDFGEVPGKLWPAPEITMQLLLGDSTLKYYDDRRTAAVESRTDIIRKSFRETTDSMIRLRKTGQEWYRVKNTSIHHLAKIPAFSYTGLKIGGWGNAINAVKQTHGPSWRMIVEMGKDSIRAFGVYPGGQSGNPGSAHYADLLQHWVEGQYYRLLFLPWATEQKNEQLIHTWTFQPA